MNTLEQASSSRQENYNYWTSQAKYYLSMYRERKALNTDKYLIDAAKTSFKTMMKLRRAQEYLNDELKYS